MRKLYDKYTYNTSVPFRRCHDHRLPPVVDHAKHLQPQSQMFDSTPDPVSYAQPNNMKNYNSYSDDSKKMKVSIFFRYYS